MTSNITSWRNCSRVISVAAASIVSAAPWTEGANAYRGGLMAYSLGAWHYAVGVGLY